jgi:hypothetical protein
MEATVKVYQLEAVSKQITEFKELYISNLNVFSQTYITKSEYHAALQDAITEREKVTTSLCSRIDTLELEASNRKKLIWILIGSVAVLFVNLVWQYVINSGKIQ